MSQAQRKKFFCWVLQIALPAAMFLVPVNELFTTQMRMFCFITLFAIVAFALETINQTCVAMLMPIAYIVLKVCDSTVAFSAWTNFVPWMCLSGLFWLPCWIKSGC